MSFLQNSVPPVVKDKLRMARDEGTDIIIESTEGPSRFTLVQVKYRSDGRITNNETGQILTDTLCRQDIADVHIETPILFTNGTNVSESVRELHRQGKIWVTTSETLNEWLLNSRLMACFMHILSSSS